MLHLVKITASYLDLAELSELGSGIPELDIVDLDNSAEALT